MSEFSEESSTSAAAAQKQQQAEHEPTKKPKKSATLEPAPAHSHTHSHDHAHDADTCDEDNCTHGEDAAAAAEKPVLLPGDIVDLVPGAEDLYIVGTVDGFGKVTQIAGLDEMNSLKVHAAAFH
jgi:hypothetical protein